jgi:DNA-binding NtrC family response regulator
VSHQNILIVDDDAIVRHVLRRLLNRIEPTIPIIEAATVTAALHALEHNPISMVVTDFHLPDGTGLNVYAAATLRNPALPVLVVSSDPGVATIALQSGAYAFLLKPFALDEFVAILAQLVKL